MTEVQKVFYGWKRAENGQALGYCQMLDADSAKEWLQTHDSEKSDPEVENDPKELADVDALREAMERAVEMTHAQGEMVSLTSFIHPVLISNIINKEIVKTVLEKGALVEQAENWDIYELDVEFVDLLREPKNRINRMELGFSVLPQSIFLGIVANFDSSISDAVKTMLKIGPDRLFSSKTTLKLSEIVGLKSIDEVIQHAIELEVYELLRGSHQDQVKYIEDNFHISIAKDWKRYPDFIEIFERRNLIAHGERHFTNLYYSKCKEAGHKLDSNIIGVKVEITSKYMHQSLDLMLEFSILMFLQFWRKKLPDKRDEAFSIVNDIIFSLIENRRYRAAQWIGEFMKSLKGAKIPEATLRMIIVNLASAYLHNKDEASCNKVLEEFDWSACSDNYKICVAALQKDVVQTVALMEQVFQNRMLTKESFKTWPVFDFIRHEEEFLNKFESLFGEKLKSSELDDLTNKTLPTTQAGSSSE